MRMSADVARGARSRLAGMRCRHLSRLSRCSYRETVPFLITGPRKAAMMRERCGAFRVPNFAVNFGVRAHFVA